MVNSTLVIKIKTLKSTSSIQLYNSLSNTNLSLKQNMNITIYFVYTLYFEKIIFFKQYFTFCFLGFCLPSLCCKKTFTSCQSVTFLLKIIIIKYYLPFSSKKGSFNYISFQMGLHLFWRISWYYSFCPLLFCCFFLLRVLSGVYLYFAKFYF